MAEYPAGRGKFFAQRALRKMIKSCAAQEIGTTAFALVMVIGHCEDAKRYTGYVTYYNDQLLPLLGIRKWDTLDRARKAAVESGWLHYESPGKHQAGRYWILIPEQFQGLDDSPTDEGLYPNMVDNNGQLLYPNDGHKSGTIGGISRVYQGGQAGDDMGDPSTLPLPAPESLPASASANKRALKQEKSPESIWVQEGFSAWWLAYPKKVAKKAACDAWKAAVKRIEAEGESREFAIERLQKQCVAFAASPKGQSGQFCPHATTWLNQGRYDDDQSQWMQGDRQPNEDPRGNISTLKSYLEGFDDSKEP